MNSKSAGLECSARGKLEGSTPTLYAAVASYNTQLKKSCHVGAISALDLRGYSHFVAIGKPQAYLFTSREQRLPSWLTDLEWDMTVKPFTTSIFAEETGLETLDISRIDLGTGKHLLAENGRYISKYQITIPVELADYE